MKIGTLLVRLRKEKGFTEKELANRIGMTEAYINLLENDKRIPSLQTLVKLMVALDVPPEIFFYDMPQSSFPDRKTSPVVVKKEIPFYKLSHLSWHFTEIQETISVEYNSNNADPAAVQIDDDTMLPDFSPGDIVIVDRKCHGKTDRESGSAKLRKKRVSGSYVICHVEKERTFGRSDTLLRRIEIHENGKNITLYPSITTNEKRVLNVKSDSYYDNNVDVVYVLGKVTDKIEFRAIPLKE